ncbi:MAG: hypothetical protein M0Q22_02380 [Sulfuritalea sp.]|jgi:hypothetical protein|nr:hypothetical protein [Sulfuritalea sp.]
MKDFNSDAHVEEWMAENGGIEGLRRALARGAFGGQNKSLASAWLLLHDRRQAEEAASSDRLLLERSVNAAEHSAQSARQSSRWAMWAAIIALVAVVVSVLHS